MNVQVEIKNTNGNRFSWNLLLLLLMFCLPVACSSTSTADVTAEPTVVEQDTATTSILNILDTETEECDEDAGARSNVASAEVKDQVDAYLAATLDKISLDQSSSRSAAVTNDLEASLIRVYREANPSVVYIIVPPIGSGSGFVYSADGYIVTNNHVVDGGRSFEVVFADGERQEARVVGTDADSDLAVLQVDALPAGVEPLILAKQETIQVGQFAVAIGNPFGEQGSMSLGIVSALDRSLQSQRDMNSGGSYALPEVIQTDTPINPGNSGGPLLNLDGEVIGINSAIISATETNSGVGFAIPVGAVRQIVPSLISDGNYVYPYMGVAFDDEISLAEQEIYGLSQTQGAYVVSITAGSPAAEAGLISANPNTGQDGDLVIAIDDQVINSFSDLNSYLVFHTKVGQVINVIILRDDEPLELQLTLGARP